MKVVFLISEGHYYRRRPDDCNVAAGSSLIALSACSVDVIPIAISPPFENA